MQFMEGGSCSSAKDLLWPGPASLEGVKSRKRAVFELLKDTVLQVDGGKCCALEGRVSLSLESRVLVTGAAGRAIAAVLLEQAGVSSAPPVRHRQLGVAHLGPQLQSAADIAEVLSGRPQVVILDEGAGEADGSAWPALFGELLQGSAIRSFQGAVVVCLSSEGSAQEQTARDLCSVCWSATNGHLLTEEVAKAPALIVPERAEPTFVDELCAASASNPDYASLLSQVTALAADCFDDFEDGEPTIEAAAKRLGWTVVALVSTNSIGKSQLLAYGTYCQESRLGGLYLARVAVPQEHRRKGYASQLVSWMVARLQDSSSKSLWVHAKPLLQIVASKLGFSYLDPACEAKLAMPVDQRESAWMALRLEPEEAAHELPKRLRRQMAKKQRDRR
mmetsp:Transcript_68454/g.123356  ORF Transcript_68454/g.123356 Transcript_68454/m.123356 type:complete len:391 (-) Transcript_68454:179-1351(-)